MSKKKQISASLFPDPIPEKLPEVVLDKPVKKEEVIPEAKPIPEPAKPYSDGINNLSEELRKKLFPNKKPPTLRELKNMKNGK